MPRPLPPTLSGPWCGARRAAGAPSSRHGRREQTSRRGRDARTFVGRTAVATPTSPRPSPPQRGGEGEKWHVPSQLRSPSAFGGGGQGEVVNTWRGRNGCRGRPLPVPLIPPIPVISPVPRNPGESRQKNVFSVPLGSRMGAREARRLRPSGRRRATCRRSPRCTRAPPRRGAGSRAGRGLPRAPPSRRPARSRPAAAPPHRARR